MKKNTLLQFMSWWPPYFGAGIRVKNISPDFTSLDVEMNLRFWNQNYLGTQFGGSLYSMTDPFFVLMLIENLGGGYIVWDKSATIQFKKPGRGRVRAHFEISREKIAEIKQQADESPKTEPIFRVDIKDDQGEVIAQVEKVLYVRKKPPKS